jgi:trehalose 6-phosphate synthase
VAQYRKLRNELDALTGRINGKFAEFDWVPVRYLNKAFSRETLAGFYRHARVGFVTPLRDGMNLVAKEYVASQDPADPGVLVLSRFAGAAREMQGALIVNPYDTEALAEALDRALAMPLDERRSRWEQMMAVLRANTITHWRESFLSQLRA